MPAILKSLLKATITLVVSACLPLSLFAQCATQISKKGQQLKFESSENYQYLRSGTQYFGIALKTVIIKKSTGDKFYSTITYTSPASKLKFGRLIFKLANNTAVSAKLRFIKVKKTDEKKSNTNIYEIDLSDANVADLQHNELKELAISIKGNISVIPVNNPKLMQEQIDCLKNASL